MGETEQRVTAALGDLIRDDRVREQAAECSNQCRSRGIVGSATDFLLCAIALARKWQILTTDTDFKTYAKAMPIAVYPFPGRSW
jgi:predicted nucleic acid-binding protein